jgi:hypothetical protein
MALVNRWTASVATVRTSGVKRETADAHVKIFCFTSKAVQSAKDAVGDRGEVAAPEGMAASPITPSYRSTVSGFTWRNHIERRWMY